VASTWKNQLTLSIFGESHGPAIGMTLDGIPAGETVDMERLQTFLNRRAPGRTPWSTPRKETDIPEFLSGLKDGKTTGAPIMAIIRNENTRSKDYVNLKRVLRPGHADFTAEVKYGGYQDNAGGGHFSGRLTAPLCIAGGIILQILAGRGITVGAHIASIGAVQDQRFDPVQIDKSTLESIADKDFPVFDDAAGVAMQAEVETAKRELDSVGGTIECAAIGLPAGLGDPIFDGMENRIASLVFGIPAVKGIEFGAGFAASAMRGSLHNDAFCLDDDTVKTSTNHHGGILGGITSAMPLLFRLAIKPTPSIGRAQESINFETREAATLEIEGRHDPCIVPRAVPCIEAVAALAIYDAIVETEGRRPCN